jgi:CBS domain-containing protein
MITVNVGSIASRDLISLEKKKTVKDAANLMVERNVGAIIALSSGEPVGIVTERDITRKVTSVAKDPSSVLLESVMSAPLVTINSTEGLGEATALMLERKIRRLLVTENGKIVGIITQRDLQEKVYDVFASLHQI